jgi:hypothetical protein
MGNTPAPPEEPEAISIHALVESIPHNPNPTNCNTPHDPIDKYTNTPMPKVHDTHPTSPFNYIDLDLVSIWENFAGGKVLIIPFRDTAHNADLHEPIKNRILFAMAELTQSQGVGVSAPTPSAEAIQAKHYPSFLMYNLTKPQKDLILDRHVWSSQAITFHATPFFPTNPDFMFTIKKFSTLLEGDISQIVHGIWHDNITTIFAQSIVDAAPEGDHATLTLAIHTFLNSMMTTCLNIKEHSGALTPRFNVYTNGSAIPRHTIWLDIHKFLSDRIYYTPMHRRGDVSLTLYTCGICHGIDHL